MFRRLEQFISDSAQADLTKATIGTMPYIRSIIEPSPNLDLIATGITPDQNISVYQSAKYSYDTQTRLNKANSECISSASPQDILNLYQQGNQQCGWYYNEQTGRGSGYLSTAKGPVEGLDLKPPAPPYRLYYGNRNGVNSLQAAQKRFDKDKCSSMTCSQAGNSTYKGVCGYCSTISKGVPIKADGTIKYPREPQMKCGGPLTNLIVNAGDISRCPAPPSQSFSTNLGIDPTTGQIAGVIRQSRLPNAGNCTTNNISNTFSGACLQSALESQGCDTEGGLFLALNGFNDAIDPTLIINKEPALGKYMETQPAFNLNRFLSARTMDEAQTQALALSQASSNGQSNAAQSSSDALAIDLCTTSGYFDDDYDFCGDLTDTTQRVSKWDIKCLQKAFIAAGLTESGSMYPTSIRNNNAYDFYNKLNTWKDVKDYMKSIHTSIYQGGKQIERFSNPDTVSAPFILQSINFPNNFVKFMGENKQLIIDVYDPNNPQSFLFVWKQGPNNSIIILPVSNQSLSLYIVKKDRWLMIASSENNHNQFRVRNGNAGQGTVSFELTSNPTLFLRHWDRRFFVDQKITDDYFPSDSSFTVYSGGQSRDLGFFQEVSDPLYPGQQEAAIQGLGIDLDLPKIGFTQAGIETFATAIYGSISLLVYYTVLNPWTPTQPLSADWEWTAYTIANYTFDSTQSVRATITLECNSQNCVCWTGVNCDPVSGSMIKQIRKYQGPTAHFMDGPRPGPRFFEVKKSIPTVIKNFIHGSNYSFTVNSSPIITIVRDPKAPFLRFEVFADTEAGKDTLFTEIRYPEIALVRYSGMPIQFQNSEIDILRIPGSAGAVLLNRNQININYVAASAWACASFVFNITSILPCDQNSSCPLLTIGTQTGSGYQIAVYGSTTGSMNLVVQPRSTNGSIVSTSIPVPILPSIWCMITITSALVHLYYINTQANMPTWVQTISLGNVKTPEGPNPLLQIGSQSSSLDFSVAWLHLFDKTITTVDTILELQGYPTGIF